MNYGQIKTQIKKLMNIYTNKGIQIADNKNADDLNRIPELLNDAQIEIAEKERLQDTFPLILSMEFDDYNKYPLPADFKKAIKITYDGNDLYTFELQEECVLLSKDIENPVLVYEKYPEEVSETTEDAFELDVKNTNLIPYYVASFLVTDMDLSTRYMNEYMRRLSNIKSYYNQPHQIIDTYGGL